MRKYRYYKKLFMYSLILSTLPVVILGFMSYYKAANEIEGKVAKENIQLLLQTKMGVEHQLVTLDNAVSQFILSPFFLSNFEKKLTFEDFIIYREFSLGMKRFAANELWNNEIILINHDKNWIISKEGLNQLPESEYFETHSLSNDITYASEWVTFSRGQNDSISLVKKLPLLSKNPKGLIIISIPANKINELINTNEVTGNFFVLDKDYHPISTNVSNNQSLPRAEIINELKTMEPNSGYFVIKNNGKKIGVNYSRSSYNGWYYLSLVSINEITKESRDIGWYTAVVCLVILIIITIIAIYWSRHLYHPVRHAFESVLSLSDGNKDLKPNDEFLWIQRGIHNFQKSKQQFERHMNNHLEHLREFFVLKIILGQVKSKEIISSLDNLLLPKHWESLSVFVIQIDTLENTNFHVTDKELLLFAINNMVSEIIPSDKRFTPIYLNEYQVTILLCNEKDPEHHKKYIYSMATKIKNNVLNQLGLKISIGISRAYNHIEDTYACYEDAIEALRYRLDLEPGVIVNIEDIKLNSSIQCTYPQQISKELIEAIKDANQKEATRLLRELMAQITKLKIPYHKYQTILIKLLINLIELIQAQGITQVELFGKKSLFDELMKFNTINEIENWLKNSIIPVIMERYADMGSTQHSNITNRVCSIIHEEFYKDLTLDTVASRINFHPSYVSRVFKKETGSSFSEYLMRYRVHEIKKLLRETNIKISEIAERFHYNSAASFIRSFRKIEGMTPGEYRKKHNV